jgi:rod shape-determining protein MreD
MLKYFSLSYIKYFFILVLLILVQKTFIWLISLSSLNITPDLVIIMVAYIGIKEGKITGTVAGFIAGILIDLLSGSFLGLQALSYCIAGFAAGYFQKDDGRFLYKFNFLIIIFISSLISNIIYYFVFFQGSQVIFTEILLKFAFTSSTYTTLVSVIYIVFPKRKQISEGFNY